MVNELPVLPESPGPYTGFLDVYESEKTRENYREALKKFLRFITQTEPDLSSDETCDEIATHYFAEVKAGRNYVYDLMQFTSTLTKTYAPATIKLTIQTICLWLEDNNLCLTRHAKKRIVRIIPHRYSVRHEAELTRTLFRNIYCQIICQLSPNGRYIHSQYI